MCQAKLAEWRTMILSQSWAIGQLFSGDLSAPQIDQFVRTGSVAAKATREPRNAAADALAAEYMKTGKLRVP